jgi:hypothetical protein
MTAKKLNFDMRTILIILIIACIAIAVVYLILSPSEESENVISVEELRLNKEYYEGKTVTVSGIYRIQEGDRDTLNPPTTDSDPNSEDYIYLDLSNINLTENPAIQGDKYNVKGEVVVTTEGFASQIQIIVESFIKV